MSIGDEAARVAQVAIKVLESRLSHASSLEAHAPLAPAISTSQAAQRLFDASLNPKNAAVSTAIQELQAARFSDFTLFSEIIPADVCQLGRAWGEDALSFFAIPLGAGRMQIGVHGFSVRGVPEDANYREKMLRLLLMMPEETEPT